MNARILVVDDDPAIRFVIAAALLGAGFCVEEAADAEAAWTTLIHSSFDAVVLDWTLPGRSGFELLRCVRADLGLRELAVIMVSAHDGEAETIAALDAGADDYVSKPFAPRELAARVRAVLRRQARQVRQTGGELLEIGGLQVNAAARVISIAGREVALAPVEFRLLHFLMCHPERVHSRRQLIDHVWGEHSEVVERTIDVQIRRLRSALAQHGRLALVQTVRGVGYRLSARGDGGRR